MKSNKIAYLAAAVVIGIGAFIWLQKEPADQPVHATINESDYDYDAVFADQVLLKSLIDQVGVDIYRLIRNNLQVISPIKVEGDYKILQGIKAHSGGLEEASVWINQKDGSILASLTHEKMIRVFLPQGMTEGNLPETFSAELDRGNYNNYTVYFVSHPADDAPAATVIEPAAVIEHDGHGH